MIIEIHREAWHSPSSERSQVGSIEEFTRKVNIGDESLAVVFTPETTEVNTEELAREARTIFGVDVRFVAADEKAILVWTRFDKGIRVWWRLVNFVAESLLEAEQG